MSNKFYYNYQMAKCACFLNDNSFDKLFAAPLPPVIRKRKIISRPMDKDEIEYCNKVLLGMGFKTI